MISRDQHELVLMLNGVFAVMTVLHQPVSEELSNVEHAHFR
jgi:hypothetical protein